MTMLEAHAEALNSGISGYHEFLLYYKGEARTVYGLVEGKDDPIFYRSIIERFLPGDWSVELVKLGNKTNVIKAYKHFDWDRFSKQRIAFFVDRDLNEYLSDIPFEANNLYITDSYSIENEAVNFGSFRRILEEILDISGLHPAEVESLQTFFETNIAAFKEFLTPVMAQILLWRRNSVRANLSDLKLSDYFIFSNGIISASPLFERVEERILHASNCIGATPSPHSEIWNAEQEFRSKGGPNSFIRGKYLLWFIVELSHEAHRSIKFLCPRITKPPKVNVTFGFANAMVFLGPRMRCPASLHKFLEKNYGDYISQFTNAT